MSYAKIAQPSIGSYPCSDSRDMMNGHRLRVFSMQYHPNDPHMLVSGGWDDTVQVSLSFYVHWWRQLSVHWQLSTFPISSILPVLSFPLFFWILLSLHSFNCLGAFSLTFNLLRFFFLLFLWDLTELYLHVLKFFYLYETLEQICSYAALLIKTMVKIVTQIFFLVVWTLLLFLLYLLSNMESFNVFGCNW